jgi:hypothetical protein
LRTPLPKCHTVPPSRPMVNALLHTRRRNERRTKDFSFFFLPAVCEDAHRIGIANSIVHSRSHTRNTRNAHTARRTRTQHRHATVKVEFCVCGKARNFQHVGIEEQDY